MSCMFKHNNIDVLYGVPVMSIDELPKICSCGASITYANEVVFVPFPEYESNEFVKVSTYDWEKQKWIMK